MAQVAVHPTSLLQQFTAIAGLTVRPHPADFLTTSVQTCCPLAIILNGVPCLHAGWSNWCNRPPSSRHIPVPCTKDLQVVTSQPVTDDRVQPLVNQDHVHLVHPQCMARQSLATSVKAVQGVYKDFETPSTRSVMVVSSQDTAHLSMHWPASATCMARPLSSICDVRTPGQCCWS